MKLADLILDVSKTIGSTDPFDLVAAVLDIAPALELAEMLDDAERTKRFTRTIVKVERIERDVRDSADGAKIVKAKIFFAENNDRGEPETIETDIITPGSVAQRIANVAKANVGRKVLVFKHNADDPSGKSSHGFRRCVFLKPLEAAPQAGSNGGGGGAPTHPSPPSPPAPAAPEPAPVEATAAPPPEPPARPATAAEVEPFERQQNRVLDLFNRHLDNKGKVEFNKWRRAEGLNDLPPLTPEAAGRMVSWLKDKTGIETPDGRDDRPPPERSGKAKKGTDEPPADFASKVRWVVARSIPDGQDGASPDDVFFPGASEMLGHEWEEQFETMSDDHVEHVVGRWYAWMDERDIYGVTSMTAAQFQEACRHVDAELHGIKLAAGSADEPF